MRCSPTDYTGVLSMHAETEALQSLVQRKSFTSGNKWKLVWGLIKL